IKVVGGSVVVLNGDDTTTIFGIGGAGQLTTSANSLQILDQSNSTNFTSMTTGGNYLYLTDGTHNLINQYTVVNGVLQPGAGSPYANTVGSTTPVWTLTSTDGTQSYLYVLNSGSSNANQGAGSISLYSVNSSNGRLEPLSGLNSQTTTGAFPVCMVNDPTNKYVYTSNADGTVTGFQREQGVGNLRALRRGSQFTANGKPTCLVTSGITS
ncbi:MAG: beta-propeller fold lactonase family protein, partial [Terriglobus roseus]|nr:beta-propeller fold lactonase family protein [Terriglobus roseus]